MYICAVISHNPETSVSAIPSPKFPSIPCFKSVVLKSICTLELLVSFSMAQVTRLERFRSIRLRAGPGHGYSFLDSLGDSSV